MSPVAPAGQFELDRQRLLAGSQLKPEHFDEFQRLCLTLMHGSAFQFILVELDDEILRQQLIAQLDAMLVSRQLRVISLLLDDGIAGVRELEARLLGLTAGHEVIHLIGGNLWFSPERWAEINTRRDTLATACRSRLVFWLAPAQVRACANRALDWWAWRSGVYAFDTQAQPIASPDPHFAPAFSRLNQAERARRIAQLRAWLGESPAASILPPLLDELADLLQSMGKLDEALHLRTEKQLPVYEELGDVRAAAITHGKIADILQVWGKLDEALRIRTEKQLPVYEELGDVRATAITHGKIADILQKWGKFDEALRIHTEKQLPVFEELGDVREVAVTHGKIADILQARGKLDEALRIRTEKQLPVYEELGDVRLAAVTYGKIADILQTRGKLDEALRIRLHKELPVFAALGDVREQLVAQTKLAQLLHQRGQKRDRPQIKRLLKLALDTADKLQIPEAAQIRAIRKDIFG